MNPTWLGIPLSNRLRLSGHLFSGNWWKSLDDGDMVAFLYHQWIGRIGTTPAIRKKTFTKSLHPKLDKSI